ncbi:MAG TPA: flavodoxin domain-containing protein [Chitinophagaceae bacterium]|nr:flavodoxin domain-containing protein [Chitinophagaceae bacterium]
MNGLIIYKGRYGATSQYAHWLSKLSGMPETVSEAIITDEVRQCDLLVLGSSVYVGKLLLARWMRRNVKLLAGKKIILFIVCGTTADETEAKEEIIMNNVPKEIRHTSEIFFLPGRIIHKNLSFTHRILLKVAGIFETNPAKKMALMEDWDKVQKENLDPVTDAIGRANQKMTVH